MRSPRGVIRILSILVLMFMVLQFADLDCFAEDAAFVHDGADIEHQLSAPSDDGCGATGLVDSLLDCACPCHASFTCAEAPALAMTSSNVAQIAPPGYLHLTETHFTFFQPPRAIL